MKKNQNVSRRNFLKKSGTGAGLLGLGTYSSNLFANKTAPGSPYIPQEKISPREVRVMSIVKSGIEDQDIVKAMIERMRIMALYKPDIVCLPEAFTGLKGRNAESVPGLTTERLAAVAKELGCYIICPMHVSTEREGKVYNSAILINREGEIAGQYNKIHPVSSESENGVIPGISPPPVFKTDFGTIGIQICFDINWIEEWKSLKDQGAEIVFWPSAYPAGRNLPAYAWMFKYYIVGCSWRDPATIYDITGDLLAMSGQWEHWAFASLNMEKELLEIAHYSRKLNEIKKKYGPKVLIRYYNDEDWITIESCSPEIRIKNILDEYELVPHWDYIKIETEEQEKYRRIMSL